MRFYIKQHVFTWGDKFSIFDESGCECFFVKGEIFSLAKKLHIYDPCGSEIALIQSSLFSFKPQYIIYTEGREAARVIKEFSFFKQRFTVSGPEWQVQGDIFDHNYEIESNGDLIAGVHKDWFTFGDAYAINVTYEDDTVLALATVIVIDAQLAAEEH